MVNEHADTRPILTIDASDRILSVNAAWSEFVAGRGTAGPALGKVLDRPVWERMPNRVVRQLWELLYTRVRRIGGSVFVPMRIDLPDERRLVDIELRPGGDGSIHHICEPLWRESRAAVALLDPAYPRDERTLRCCQWCQRIQVRLGLWEEIEKAQQSLSIMADATLPQIRAGACSSCQQSLLKSFPARVA